MNAVSWIRWEALRVWHFLAEGDRTACGIGVLGVAKVRVVHAEQPPSPENICPKCAHARQASLPLPFARRFAP